MPYEMIQGLINESPQEQAATDCSEPDTSSEISGRKFLIAAISKLESAESLLLDPKPERIHQAGRYLTEAAEEIQALQQECGDPAPDGSALQKEVLAFECLSRRVLALLHGALRVQWHRMRRMGSYIETYTAEGATKVCVPGVSRVDLNL
jgi:hypothetical protein